ncbi:phosphatidate cytidylyltransferase [Spirochaeta dissipatitropha]
MNKKQKNVRNRLLVFFIGIPLIFCLLIFFPHANHAAVAVVVAIVAFIASYELYAFFEPEFTVYAGSRIITPLLAASFPLLAYAEGMGWAAPGSESLLIALAVSILLSFQAFRKDPQVFSHIKGFVSTSIFLFIYPGLLLGYIPRIASLPMPSHLLVVFAISVYLNDSAAYAGGMLFGKGNGGIVPISPNKSIAGFISGLIGSMVVFLTARALYPELLPGSLLTSILFALLIGSAAIVGDLAESAIKRSAAQKDSGSIIPGRGGLLDSIDSLAFAAPFFFYGYMYLYL